MIGSGSCLLSLLIFLLNGHTYAQLEPSSGDQICFKHDSSCSDCLRIPDCQWCSHVTVNTRSNYHCFSRNTNLGPFCQTYDIKNLMNTKNIVKNEELSEVSKDKRQQSSSTGNIIQLKPQAYKLKLRKNEPVTLRLTYRQVKDYPLDLYYLMDLSKSMRQHKETLANLGKDLADKMRSLTSQFRLGFGSFVDKVMLPFVNTHPKKLEEPCGRHEECEKPFSFKNNLPLTENEQEFKTKVKRAKLSTNLDVPEGGFDALMQAMVCQKEIGWNQQVRKIIIFSTDGQFHIAGDGKLAGVVTPNDEKCHLNEDGFYDQYDKYDYPSIGQINAVSQKEGVNIIFAVKGNEILYKELSSSIEGSSFALLSSNSDNIVELVAEVYNTITGRVEIQQSSDSLDSRVKVSIEINCNGDGMTYKPINYCEGVKEGQDVNIRANVELTDCPENRRQRKSLIKIGTLQEMTEIEIDMLCDCDCEFEGSRGYVDDGRVCNGEGSLQCGVCICNPDSFGEQCQCSNKASRNSTSGASDHDKCRNQAGLDTEICSGQGTCECETCICNKDRSGKFCECNEAPCRYEPDAENFCSGNGICKCDKCDCNEGWQGRFCECHDQQSCIPQGSNQSICSGNGVCECGLCSCFQDNIPYTGEFCEECPSCDNGKCDEFQPCVQCQQFKSGQLDEEACDDCNITVHATETLPMALGGNARLCTYMDKDTGCDFSFTYKFITKSVYQIFVKDPQDCPEPVNIIATTIYVVGGVVAVGILTLLIWKLITTIHDRREFARFTSESENMKWEGGKNPLYKEATTTIPNPAFKSH